MNVFYDNSDATACSLTNYSLQTTDDGGHRELSCYRFSVESFYHWLAAWPRMTSADDMMTWS